ncbi:MAG: hypothetical protein K2W96_21285 [Gemmataceae bacterium]|nr:hypothetical protein [Gemmataceae bacterium]
MKGVTYGRLDAVLRSYGFQVRDVDEDTRVYACPDSEALFAVPILSEAEPVSTFHLLAAKATLDAYGIADGDELTARLQKAG